MSDKKLEHSLLSNGLDFIKFGLEEISDKDTSKVKYGILHLFAGVVLVLKERINQEHWSLLFLKSEQANHEKYKAGDFVSIDYDTITKILKNVCQINIEEKDTKAIEELRKIRNKVEHFRFEVSTKAITPVAGRVLVFALEFIKSNFDTDEFDAREEELFDDLKNSVRDFEAYMNAKRTDLEEYVKKYDKDVFHCPECYEKALVREDDDFKCHSCDLAGVDLKNVIETHLEYELGMSYYEASAEGYELPIVNCDECLEDSLLPSARDYKEYICINCGDKVSGSKIENCGQCGNSFKSTDSELICSSCWDYQLYKD